MSIIARSKGEGQGYDPLPEGSHLAICYAVIDLGDQWSQAYGKMNRKIRLMWEVPGETIVIDGKTMPRAIGKTYTLSLSPKSALLKDLQSWRGRPFNSQELDGFDLKDVLAKPCLIQVLHNPKPDGNGVYADVSAVMSIPKGMLQGKVAPVNPTIYFDLSDASCIQMINTLTDKTREMIMASQTWQAAWAAWGTPVQTPAQVFAQAAPKQAAPVQGKVMQMPNRAPAPVQQAIPQPAAEPEHGGEAEDGYFEGEEGEDFLPF